MAGTVHAYRWNHAQDTIWHVCARHLPDAGYPDLPSFVEQTRTQNAQILDWMDVPDQTIIILPYIS